MDNKTTNIGSESGHWYNNDGLVELVPNVKEDKMIKPTLREAKRLNLLPSVTSILQIINKPALTKWITNEHIRACSYIDKQGKDESFTDYCKRVNEQMQKFNDHAQVGTNIHAEIAKWIDNNSYEFDPIVNKAIEFIKSLITTFNPIKIQSEKPFANYCGGYGGTIDLRLICKDQVIILDFKSTDDDKIIKGDNLAYKDSHLVQLVAYGMSESNFNIADLPHRYINVFIGRLAGDISVKEWDKQEDVLWAGEYFKAVRNLYKIMKGI